MFLVDLVCAAGHRFEASFDSHKDVASQLESGAVACPACGDTEVTRRLSFGRVGSSRSGPRRPPLPSGDATSMGEDGPIQKHLEAPARAKVPPMPLELQKALSQVLRAVRAHGEDVGPAFADVARRIHRGEEAPRLIYGESTPVEEEALVTEGVPFAKVPIPEIDEN